jgi:hypothetical protein
MTAVDWGWKLREAFERLKTRYEHIGRKTGAPFLAIVYPPEAHEAVLKEWRTLAGTLGDDYDICTIDVLDVTMAVVSDIGSESVVATIAAPMPGSDPQGELGSMWTDALATKVRQVAGESSDRKRVIVLENLAALHPAAGPRAVMQKLWDTEQSSLDGPVVVLIPGTLVEPRVYSFVDCREELMYRGDIL